MRFSLERVTQPDIEPISLVEMKRHLRAYDDVADEDDDILMLIKGAREWAEHETGRALIEQQWRLSLGSCAGIDRVGATGYYSGVYPLLGREIQLRRSPVLSIVSFDTVDSAGATTGVDVAQFELVGAASKWPRIAGLSGTAFNGNYQILFRAGFADRSASPQQGPEVVPATIKQAMKLWAEANYTRNDRNMNLLLDTAEKLLCTENCNLGIA